MKKSTVCGWLSLVCFLLLLVMMQISENSSNGIDEDMVVIIGCGSAFFSIFVFLPLRFIFRWFEKRKAYQALPQKERERMDADRERKIAESQARAQEMREEMIADRTIVSTAIVNSTTIGKQKASVTSSVVRGAVGGAVFGPVGLIAGAVTPKKTITTKTKDVTFSIRYASGRCTTEKVKFGSRRYNELIKYIA